MDAPAFALKEALRPLQRAGQENPSRPLCAGYPPEADPLPLGDNDGFPP